MILLRWPFASAGAEQAHQDQHRDQKGHGDDEAVNQHAHAVYSNVARKSDCLILGREAELDGQAKQLRDRVGDVPLA